MIRSKPTSFVLAIVLIAAGCGGDDGEAPPAAASSPSTAEEEGGDGRWTVDTSDCPDGAEEPIEGTIRIGTTMPLSGGPAAAAFAPLAAGLEGFISYANAEELLPGYTLEIVVEDDQFDPARTPAAVERLLDEAEVDVFASMVGHGNNLAVRDVLNEECYPQLLVMSGSPIWGDVESYPWTMGSLPPYSVETGAYVDHITADLGEGTTAALFFGNNEFGHGYADAFREHTAEAGVEIVDEQTIEVTDSNPPQSQITSMAAKRPDVIMAVPIGAQCISFLNELGNARAANPGWEPRLYITSSCANPLLLAISGAAADGLITGRYVLGADDPATAGDPAVAAFKEAAAPHIDVPDGKYQATPVGWNQGEMLLAILREAADRGPLTRASILEAARTISFTTPLMDALGITLTTDGEEDPFLLESIQVVQYDHETGSQVAVGELFTESEGETEVLVED